MIKIHDEVVFFGKFPDNETKINEDQIFEALMNKSDIVPIIFKYESDQDLFQLFLLKSFFDQHPLLKRNVYDLYVTFFPYSQMDRTENHSAFTLKYVSNFINSMGFNSVTIYEPHSDVTLALVDNSHKVSTTLHFLGDVLREIEFDPTKDYIVYPDATANKRYGHIHAINTLTGNKHRNFQTGEIESLIFAGEIREKGFKALMLDDLCMRGGTFIMTANKLVELGASEIYLLTGHAVDAIFDGRVLTGDLIKKTFTTNSLLTKEKYWQNAKYKDTLQVFDVLYPIKNPKTVVFN